MRRKLPIIFLFEINSRKGDVNAFIAAYILEHLEEIQDGSIRELAAKINTSPSAISRFCRETGIKDYNELMEMIRNTGPVCSSGTAIPRQAGTRSRTGAGSASGSAAA